MHVSKLGLKVLDDVDLRQWDSMAAYDQLLREKAKGRVFHGTYWNFDIISDLPRAFSSAIPPHTRRAVCSTKWSC